MRYQPYEYEYAALPGMGPDELFDYFLTRVVETEELWGLGGPAGWVVAERGGRLYMPLWPYRRLALDCARGPWAGQRPQAESLEDFMDQVLPRLARGDVRLELMPRPQAPGCVMPAARLLDILAGVLDAGTYTLDG